MDENNRKATSGGIGCTLALGLLFIGLKLTGVIGWSWLWVLSPLWILERLIVGILTIINSVVVIEASVKKNF